MTEKEFLEASKASRFGVNFNGPTSSYYMSHSQAVAKGMTHTAKYTVERYVEDWYYYGHYGESDYRLDNDDYRIPRLSTAIWSDEAFSVRYPLANGVYLVRITVGENYKDNHKNFEVIFQGQRTIEIQPMRKGEYMNRGCACELTVSDGQLYLDVRPIGNSEVHLMSINVTPV